VTTNERTLSQTVWDFFCSLKLTMFLFIGLAVVSIIGTVIPQGPQQEYLQQIGPAKIKLYQALGFFDMYHSWWFILLLYLLTVNLIACSLKRLPHIWKIVTSPVRTMQAGFEKTLSCTATFSGKGCQGSIVQQVTSVLEDEFAAPVVTEADGAIHLFAQKTPWCRLAVYVVHLSVVIIFIGALIGTFFGYKGYVSILEGEQVASVADRSGKEIPLGFSVRCEKFGVTFYDNGAPKEFKSILTVLENGKPVTGYERVPVIVNDPLSYRGITFYQSSYGNGGDYDFTVSDRDGKNPASLSVSSNGSVSLPDGSTMHVLESTPDISKHIKGLSGPAAQVELHPPQGEARALIVFANYPELNLKQAQKENLPLVLQYKGSREKMFTGLQVAKDPGVWVVWLGCLLMCLGIYAAFFLSHRRIWVRIEGSAVTIGGNASKHPEAFRQAFEKLANRLKDHLSREEQP
jgi:cytochrome c biogenesis protein